MPDIVLTASPIPAALEPSPAVELRRAQLVAALRSRYDRACRELMFLTKPPADSIDRWIMEQLAQPRGRRGDDPLLPKPRIAETSRVLLRELVAEVPLRCPTRTTGAPGLEALRRYHSSAQAWLGRLKQVHDLHTGVEALGKWIDDHAHTAGTRRRFEDCPFRRKLVELSEEHGLSRRFHVEVEPLAVEVIGVVSAEAEQLVASLRAFESRQGSDGSVPERIEVSLEATPVGHAAATVSFNGDALRLSGLHLRKLRQLYEAHHPPPVPGSDDSPSAATAWDERFRRRLYVMLRRYVTFIGLDPAEEGARGGNMHAAAPETVFAWLKGELGVCCELFASPLNCYFSRFFSAFPDVDAPFGSLGSFFDAAELPEGSYEVGPPYTEEVLDLTAQRLLWLLRAGDRALSFVLFVPDWEGCGALELLGGADFAAYRRLPSGAAYALAPGREHHYITGVQFFADAGADTGRRYYVVPHATRIYVLQSEAGAARWPFTEARERALLGRMRAPPGER